jgi:hypothetical protein
VGVSLLVWRVLLCIERGGASVTAEPVVVPANVAVRRCAIRLDGHATDWVFRRRILRFVAG